LEAHHYRGEGWRSRIAILAAGYLVFESLTGLLILFAPFSVNGQVTVLVHTAAGVFFFAPCVYYLWIHWAQYRAKPISHIVVVGYLGLAACAACLVSGVVLTVQAIWGARISYAWDATHIASTFGTLVFIGFHLTPLFRRDFAGVMAEEKRQSARAYAVGAAGHTAAGVVLIALGTFGYGSVNLRNELPQDYSYAYGSDRPFAPSLARTENGSALDPRVLSGSETCGTAGCHTQIVEEWQASAHRWAAMDAGFQKIQTNMASQNGPESTRYCGGCHDPISLFSGAKNLFVEQDELTSLNGYQEGVSCLVCHAIREVDVKGNADYVVGMPKRYMYEIEYAQEPSDAKRLVRDFLIRSYPRQHLQDLSKTLFKAPEYCAACHKQFIDQEINRVGWVQLQNQYDNWKQSRWNQPGEPEKTIECRECHMPLGPSEDPSSGDRHDYNRSPDDGRHRSHRFLASNQFMPAVLKIPGAERQVELTEKWLQGRYEVPEIADKWSQGAVVGVEILAPPEVAPGDEAEIKLVITSNKVGHDFPTGPLDIIQAWVEMTVVDDKGREAYATGRVDEKGFIEPGTFMLKAEPVDQQGNLIDRHNLWEMVGVRHRRALFPGFSDTIDFSFFCPQAARPDAREIQKEDVAFGVLAPAADSGWLDVKVRLRYRKVSQYLLNFMFGEESGLTAPITDLAVETARIPVRQTSSGATDATP
jgi:hypothetical protein